MAARAGPATLAEAVAVGDTYHYEDPAVCWVSLVEATRDLDTAERKRRVAEWLFIAKNSHWTMELWKDLVEAEEDIEYGGPDGWEDHEEERSTDDDGHSDLEMDEGAAALGSLVEDAESVKARTRQTARRTWFCTTCGSQPCVCNKM